MKETLIWIGSFVLAVILMAIPILLTCSVIMQWDKFIQIILAIPFVFETILLVLSLQDLAIEEEDKK